MANNSEVLSAIMGANLTTRLYQTNLWRNYVQDESGQLPYGKSIKIPKIVADDDKSGTGVPNAYEDAPADLSNYSEDSTPAQLLRGTPQMYGIEQVTLNVDKEYEVDFLVSAVAERRVRPSLMTAHTTQVARRVQERINSDIRAIYDGAPSGNEVSAAISVAANAFGQKAHYDKIIEALDEARIKADGAPYFFPNEGRICITSPRNYAAIVKYLVAEKLFLVQGATDRAGVDGSVVKWAGWTIIKDNSLSTTINAANGNQNSLYFLASGYPAVAGAYELSGMRTYESEVYRGMRTSGIYTYGHILHADHRLLIQKTTIT